MNKHTADRMQFVGRVGNHATKPSARGVNLLDWGQDESLTPEQQRAAMARRVQQISEIFRDKLCSKTERPRLVREQQELVEKMRAIRPSRRAPEIADYFVGVARGRLTKVEFSIWMAEAVKAQQAEQDPGGLIAGAPEFAP